MTSPRFQRLRAGARRHAAMVAVTALAAVLLVTGLGRDYLWADEGDTAVLAQSILQFGVPKAWDGVTFTDSDYGARLTEDFVMVSHPWVQYYATAASFGIFGASAGAARLPFAISGLLTIVLVYVILVRASGSPRTAASAALLVTLSVQFLIFARQSRHYSLNAALTCLLVLQFTRLRSWSQSLAFAAVGILLFHTHPGAAAPLAALAALTVFHRPFAALAPWFWRAVPVIALFSVPWLFVARSGYAQNATPLGRVADLGPRLIQFAVECLSVAPLIGALAVGVAAWSTGRLERAPVSGTDRPRPAIRSLVLTLLAIVAAYGVLVAATQSPDTIWVTGLRSTPAIIPFACILLAIAISAFARGNWRISTALVALFVLTRAGDITPWTAWAAPALTPNRNALATFHVPTRPLDRFVHTELGLYAGSLAAPNPGTVERVAVFLRGRAKPGDIVITNYAWEPLYFHTGLPQGMTILPSYPIYEAARTRKLPSYVFGSDGVRWIVWRRTWGAYRGQQCDQLVTALVEAGVHVELVASMAETTWENRENIHFRRFPNGRYLYKWFENVPETLIYRVDWPPGVRSLSRSPIR